MPRPTSLATSTTGPGRAASAPSSRAISDSISAPASITLVSHKVRQSTSTAAPAGAAVLVDCLTLWLTNVMLAGADIESEIARLEGALAARPGPVVLVANEVGLGVVPDNALARRFRDAAGRLNQRLAAQADGVVLLVAGIPMKVK